MPRKPTGNPNGRPRSKNPRKSHTLRFTDDAWEWLQSQEGGPNAWLERQIAAARAASPSDNSTGPV